MNVSISGFGGAVPSGTTLKYNPPASQDTMVKNGQTQNINTRHQCITAMKEYQSKSLEVICYWIFCPSHLVDYTTV